VLLLQVGIDSFSGFIVIPVFAVRVPWVARAPSLYWSPLPVFIGGVRFPPVGPTVGYVKSEKDTDKDKRNTEANNPSVRPIRFGIFLYIIFLNSKF
jgi:hypothetical protein